MAIGREYIPGIALGLFVVIVICYMFIVTTVKGSEKQVFTQQENWIYDFVDKAYIIALPQRRKSVLKILGQVGIEPAVHPAYLKKYIDKRKLIDEGFILPGTTVTDARISCHYSHMQVLQAFLSSGAKTCLIFEDDLQVKFDQAKTKKYLQGMWADLPETWDVISIGKCYDSCSSANSTSNPLIVKAPYARCRHAYIVNRIGAKKILNMAKPMLHLPGDEMIANLVRQGKLQYYSSATNLFDQDRQKFGSTLNNGDGNMPECTPQ
uniref:Glycosyl transferase family 25 domain-containing protein n=1 Tax=viral metagenome TaxID=1070528 RepID=A0A6C0KD15_9ZZZZ